MSQIFVRAELYAKIHVDSDEVDRLMEEAQEYIKEHGEIPIGDDLFNCETFEGAVQHLAHEEMLAGNYDVSDWSYYPAPRR